MESNHNASRFLDAYAELETILARLANETKYVPFSQLLSRLSNKNRIINHNLQTLREYNELRNAIVHMRGDNREIIAEPCDSVVENIERILRLLKADDSILNYARKPVVTVKLTDSIREVFRKMEKMDTTKIPVYEGHQYIGLLTSSMIAKWALEHNAQDGTVEQALQHKDNERVLFLSAHADAQLALRGFEKAMRKGNTLRAILITEHGKPTERPLGIIAPADFSTIMED